MPKRPPPTPAENKSPQQERLLSPAVLTALIALLGTVITACLSSPTLVALVNRSRPAAPTAVAQPVAASVAPLSISSDAPTVTIEGPSTAALNTDTYFTFISTNAVRGVWSISGFQNEPVTVEPLGPAHQIFVHPSDAGRRGDTFTIVLTVYDSYGNAASARHRFTVDVP